MARSKKKLGEILAAKGVISSAQAQKAAKDAKKAGRKIGEALVDAGMANEAQVSQGLAEQFGMEYVDLSANGVADKVDMSLIDQQLVKKYQILPLGKSGNRMTLLIHDPMNLEMLDNLRFRLNAELDLKVTSREQIRKFLDSHESGTKQVAAGESLITGSIDATVDKSVDKSIDVEASDSPVVRLVNRILSEAVRLRASDIHVEPMGDRVRLRYRIDGVCIERDNLPKRMQNALLSRFKLMAGVNIAEKRTPQDGRIKLTVDDTVIDYRVSSCPAYHGESIVSRILRPDAVRIGLENLGFEPDMLTEFNKIIRRPNGIFLVTGPTGSGKTTTLYSALDVLNRPDRKIITAEDPVEYNFEGINQCQVRDSIGLTFPAILRSMLRQAPNIILVGEIRDREVGEIAIQAALTGHLVFSTLHTNDAPSAMTRLIDMGVKPFLVASSIQAVLAQRLVRVLCDNCKQPDPDPDRYQLKLAGITDEDLQQHTVYQPVGCSSCSHTGFRGRKGIFEMMEMSTEIRELAFKGAATSRVRKAALAGGMRPLVGDGRLKILNGMTTPDEVARLAQTEGVLQFDPDEIAEDVGA